MRGAVAVAGDAGQGAALDGRARRCAGDRGRVKQPQLVAVAGRVQGDQLKHTQDLRRQSPHSLVVAGLFGPVGEQVTEPIPRHRQETAIAGMVKQHLGDRQTDHLRIAGPGRAAGTTPLRQGIIHQHIKCREQGVEVGVHEASKGRRCKSNANFGAFATDPCPRPNKESTI